MNRVVMKALLQAAYGSCRVRLGAGRQLQPDLQASHRYRAYALEKHHARLLQLFNSNGFAAAALPDENEKAEPDTWLEVDPPFHKEVKYTSESPITHPSENAATDPNTLADSASEDDEHLSLADLDRAMAAGEGNFASRSAGDESAARELARAPEQASTSGWETYVDEQGRQTRFTPHGEPPKHKYSREKHRPSIGPKKQIKPPLPHFEEMLPRLMAYKDKFGDCLVPKRYWEDYELGDWCSRVRGLLRDKKLPEEQFKVLDDLSFPWLVPVEVANWEVFFHELRRYQEEYGHMNIPFKWKDPMADFNNHFARWFHAQPTLFLQRRLRPDQVRKLLVAGYDMREVTGDTISKDDYIKAQKMVGVNNDKNDFEIMFAELEAWKATYFTTIIPRMVYDNPVLGQWAWSIRRDYRRKALAQWKIDRLDKIEFLWKVDSIASKWHSSLHEARRYKEVHGTAAIPEDYANREEPGWVEAAQWLQRQAKLFRKQKLIDKRYRIMREVLGIKFVRQYAPRVQENRIKKGIHATKSKPRSKYAPPIHKMTV